MSIKNFLEKIYENERELITFKGSTSEEHKMWKEMALRELRWYLRLDRLNEYIKKCEPEKISEDNTPYFKRTKYRIETFESVYMEYYILEPFQKNGKAVLALHGHGCNGKEVLAGVVSEEYKEKSSSYNYTYALYLAKMGYTVYIPDLLGHGARSEIIEKDSNCNEINNIAAALGFNIQGMIVAELMRFTEVMENSGFENIIVCGFSGGGLFSLLLGAVDERIKSVISSGYLHSYKSTIMSSNFCGCNFVSDLWKRFDVCDYASLIAPKKLAAETGKDDHLNIDAAVVADYVKEVYNLYDGNNFVYNQCEGGHKWYGSLYDTIKKWEG